MMIDVEAVNKMVPVPAELFDKVKKLMIDHYWGDESNPLEQGIHFEFNNIHYSFEYLGGSEWEVDYKYEYSTDYYRLVSIEGEIVKNTFNLIIEVPVTRTGSYYTDWHYSYEFPEFTIAAIEHIPEVVIPAHDEVRFRTITEGGEI